jgi:hypothetical protein
MTKTKMKFNEPLANHIPAAQLLKKAGGDVDFVYEHGVYWPTLNALCEQRRKEAKERWVTAGKKVGESETYLKGGEGSVSVSAVAAAAEVETEVKEDEPVKA